MTELRGQLSRQMKRRRINRPVVVTLDAETQRIGFREKGSRHTYWLYILTAFEMAIRAEGR